LAHLALVGGAIVGHEGDLEAALRAAAPPDRVTFVGHVDDAGPWLAAADVALVPSRHEAFGLAVVEALAHGTPVVATDVDGPRAILDGGRGGTLVPPGDAAALAAAVAAVLADATRRDEARRLGPVRAAAFTPGGAAQAWHELLDG